MKKVAGDAFMRKFDTKVKYENERKQIQSTQFKRNVKPYLVKDEEEVDCQEHPNANTSLNPSFKSIVVILLIVFSFLSVCSWVSGFIMI